MSNKEDLVDQLNKLKSEINQLDIKAEWLAEGIDHADKHGMASVDHGFENPEKLRHTAKLLLAKLNGLWLEYETVKARLREKFPEPEQGGRKAAVEAYCRTRSLAKAAIYRTARVDRSDYYKWEKGEWPDGSAIDERIRRALTE